MLDKPIPLVEYQPMEAGQKSLKNEARFVALMSLAEVGLGSLIHAFNIPLGGHFLSLNQSLLLCRQILESDQIPCRRKAARSSLRVSVVTALLKSLSPAGRVLTPMIAITMQGLLFAFGILLGGAGNVGMILGAILAALWGIFQPLFVAWLIYGQSFFEAAAWAWKKLALSIGLEPVHGVNILLALILLKILLAITIVFSARLEFGGRWSQKLIKHGKKVMLGRSKASEELSGSILKESLKDLFSPLFLGSMLLTFCFFYFSQSETRAGFFWALMRPISGAFMLFYGLRMAATKSWFQRLAVRAPGVAALLSESKKEIQKIED